ncbi:uncharacterized protein BDW70DRAFT_165053 [Aspergillus foveolatus]|uniref:uncharacterized protein n=1 Tax=Aspergillus foveolatus TaxID=210207 RepID=UPI003CCD6CC8
MSNRVPVMTSPEHFPYCFWHLDIPREETLKQLLTHYPGNTLLRYQVGRACAVGRYTTLYHELHLLPEVTLAEEAHDNRKSGHEIYEAIMEPPVRYTYMDDYNHCLHPEPLAGAHLFLVEVVFDITEDRCIDTDGIKPLARPVDPQAIELLYTPLSPDLPTVDKDLLILMAAWSGNIDRYPRLRQPKQIERETPCIVRGIHHRPLFAKRWLMQPRAAKDEFIRRVIHSRCVMNNDLSWLTDLTPESALPDPIWYPQVAHEATYRELMRLHSFATLVVIPNNAELVMDTKWSPNKYYEEYLQHRASECGINLKQILEYEEDWTGKKPHVMLDQDHVERGFGSQAMWLDRKLTLDHVGFQPEELATVLSSILRVLLHASVADPSMRPSSPYKTLDLVGLYEEAPYVETKEGKKMVGLQPRAGPLRRGRGKGY